MKNSFVIIFVCTASILYGQRKIAVYDFLPPIFYTKQSLIAHYQDQKLNYKLVLQDLENKSGDGVKIISRDSNQITYTQIYRSSADTVTCVLLFNASQQLIQGEMDYKDCYNRTSGSDIPEPFLSKIDITYNTLGQIEQKSGHCATSAFSTRTNYYYNPDNELASITLSEGYTHPALYQKIVFVDTTFRSGQPKGTSVFILNPQFDYTTWLKSELIGTDYSEEIQSTQRDSSNLSIFRRVQNKEGNNYVYEFDSLGRITSLWVLDANAGLGSLLSVHGCDLCEEECASPSIVEFYYQTDKIVGVASTSFSKPGAQDRCRCRCLIQIKYRKEKIKEVNFYTGLYGDYPGLFESRPALVKKWTKRKGFQNIEENVVWPDGPRGLFKRKIR